MFIHRCLIKVSWQKWKTIKYGMTWLPTHHPNHAQQFAIPQSAIHQSAFQQSAIQQFAIQQSAIQQSAIQQSAIQQSAIQQSAIQQSAIQQSSIQQFAIQQYAFKLFALKPKHRMMNPGWCHQLPRRCFNPLILWWVNENLGLRGTRGGGELTPRNQHPKNRVLDVLLGHTSGVFIWFS